MAWEISNLKLRIHRLLTGQQSSSQSGKVALFFLAVLILVSGWLNLRLVTDVAQASNEATVVVNDEELEDKVNQFVELLASGETNDQFREMAKSQGGDDCDQ